MKTIEISKYNEDEICAYYDIDAMVEGVRVVVGQLKIKKEQDNAAFICKAVNNYDSLLKNLKDIIERIEEHNFHTKHFPDAWKRAKEAIKNTDN